MSSDKDEEETVIVVIPANKKQILVCGYINQYTRTNYLFIPNDIIPQFMQFYSPSFHWKIDSKMLSLFVNAKDDEQFQSAMFECHNILFRCSLISKGREPKNDSIWDQFLFESFLKPNIKVVCHFDLFCDEKVKKKKQTSIFKSESPNELDSDSQWVSDSFPLFECEEYNELNFIIDCDVLYVCDDGNDGNDDKCVVIFDKNVKIKQSIEYEWIIDGSFKEDFQNCKVGHGWYSPYFDDCNQNWSLYCMPNGWVSFPDYVFVSLRLYRLPSSIPKVKVNIELIIEQCTDDNDDQIKRSKTEKLMSFKSFQESTCSWPVKKSDFNSFLKAKYPIKFKVNVSIIDVWIDKDQAVPLLHEKWKEYGVIMDECVDLL